LSGFREHVGGIVQTFGGSAEHGVEIASNEKKNTKSVVEEKRICFGNIREVSA
jgi:hypothetical protein